METFVLERYEKKKVTHTPLENITCIVEKKYIITNLPASTEKRWGLTGWQGTKHGSFTCKNTFIIKFHIFVLLQIPNSNYDNYHADFTCIYMFTFHLPLPSPQTRLCARLRLTVYQPVSCNAAKVTGSIRTVVESPSTAAMMEPCRILDSQCEDTLPGGTSWRDKM